MKISKLVFAAAMAITVASANAQVISQWTFEVNTPSDVTDNGTGPSTAADVGTGTATGLHASALTDWTTPSGNGSSNSFSSNNWAIGGYYQFSLSTVGFSDIQLSWDQTRSSTGPGTFDLAYSTDGGSTFNIALDNYTVPAIGWDPAVPDATGTTHFTFDFSGIPAVNNDSDVVFRLVADSAPSSTAGTNRVDNFTVSVIPEPSTWAMIGVGSVLLLASQRLRRRKA